ncbi:major facilitator superfamily transporter [Thozetella sp. PMI_491]|nr:major facilitator superfamily transporter [Thozetella sp. PMI_491]
MSEEHRVGIESGERLPPGTVHLVDIEGNLSAKHADGANQRDIILVPRPSEDPEDPLNWTPRRKILATSCVIVYTICIAIPSSAVYSIVTPLRAATGLSLSDVNNGTGIMFLFYGWGCLIWQPLALQYGKRPAYLFSLIANIIILATGPMCTTPHTYQLNRILLGIFGSPVESLCEISITDIWFAHERPKYLAWYGWGLSLTGKLAPMLSGFINYGMGWEWTLYWCAIWNGLALIYCFLFMEETNYDRKHLSIPAEATDSASGTVDVSGEPEKEATPGKIPEEPAKVEQGEISWPRKTYLQKLGVKDKPRPNRLFDMFLGPLKGFTYPSVVYGGLMYGANNLVWSGVQNATAGTVYTTVYGFSTAGVAAAYAGGVIGSIIGGYYCGKVGRILTIKLARRNNGISEPEHTLYLFIASMIIVPFSMLLYGLGVAHHIHWFGLVFSQATLAINNALCVAGGLGYTISSYRELSGDFVVTNVLIRNTLSFAINYAITPWLNASGYQNTYITVAVIGFLWNASLFVMVRYGRKLRESTAQRYWRNMEKAQAKGLSH